MTSDEPRQPLSAIARAAAALEPTPTEALLRAIEALRDDRLDEAQQRLDAVLARWPEQPDAVHYLGVLRHSQRRYDESVELIRRAITLMPASPGPWNNLGNVLLSASRFDEAAVAYERSIALAGEDPEAAGALNNLGVLHRKQGRLEDAESAARRAVDLRPEFAEAWYNLSQTLMIQGRIAEGLLANSHAVLRWPRELMARDQVIRALLHLGERDRAAELYREWLAEEPDNPVVRHQLAACEGSQAPVRASDAYVEMVFDSFAQSFDAKLESLHYRAPELVAQALRQAAGEPEAALDIVDLGCGTGLCGPLIRPWARQLAGCDLSVGMLRKAKARQVYDVLHKAELVYYLQTQPAAFDAAVSADTLCYFGELGEVMNAAATALHPGGWLIFTVEALPDDAPVPHRLQPNGRYAHSGAYLRDALAAAGLVVRALVAQTLRFEAGRPVAGWVVTATRP